MAASSQYGTVSVLLGDGTGAITLASSFLAEPYTVFTVGDLNNDGNQDLVNPGLDQNISIRLSMGDGTFAAPVYFSAGDEAPTSIKICVLNLDGKQDLVTGNNSTGNVSVLLGTGAGSFGTATTFAIGANASLAAVGDFNGDGPVDIATIINDDTKMAA